MKDTTVVFISAVSCIYHWIFSFWICLWWCQTLTPSDFRQPVWYFQWSAVTGYLFQLLIWSLCTQQSGLNTLGRAKSLLRWELLFALRLLLLRGEWSAWAQRLLPSGRWLSTRSQELLFQFSPQSLWTQSLLKYLQSMLPLPLPKSHISGYKGKFVCWPFKQPLHLQPSVSGKEQPCCSFHGLLSV